MTPRSKAALAILIAAAIWSTGGIVARILPLVSLNVYFYSTLVFALALVVTTIYRGFKEEHLTKLSRSVHVRLAAGGLANLLINSFIILAYQSIPLSTVIFLMEVAPIYTLLLSRLFLKESLSRQKIIALIFAMGGIVLILRPSVNGLSLGFVLALVTGLLVAIDYVVMRSLKEISGTETAWWRSFYALIFSLPITLLTWQTPTLNSTFFVSVLWSGIALLGIGNMLFLFATKHLSAGRVSLLRLADVVFTVCWGILLFHEIPSPPVLVGGLLIVASAVQVTVRTTAS